MAEKFKEGIQKYMFGGVITVCVGMAVLGTYARVWEYKQPNQLIEKARIESVERFTVDNDLHFNVHDVYRIKINHDNRAVYFHADKWDETVKEGDLVDIVAKRSFPLFEEELDGLHITDHK